MLCALDLRPGMGRKRSRCPGAGALQRKRQRWMQGGDAAAASSSGMRHDATAWQCVDALIKENDMK